MLWFKVLTVGKLGFKMVSIINGCDHMWFNTIIEILSSILLECANVTSVDDNVILAYLMIVVFDSCLE